MKEPTESVDSMVGNMRGTWTGASTWTRREWATTNALMLAGIVGPKTAVRNVLPVSRPSSRNTGHTTPDVTADDLAPAGVWEGIVQQAVEAAVAAGASYADARITRKVEQRYRFGGSPTGLYLNTDLELNGLGVRVLVKGTWGFAAAPRITRDTAAQLGRTAVAQAKGNALGAAQPVSLGRPSTARGQWTTPMRIDPFTISLEEKCDTIAAWIEYSRRHRVLIDNDFSKIHCARQESVLATSEGVLCSQRFYETGGTIRFTDNNTHASVSLDGLQTAGRGWELFEDAHIFDQIGNVRERLRETGLLAERSRPVPVGRYTIVCDGQTMAALADATLGVATHLDRARGYEANASGTSFLNDPFAMLGSFQVASSLVTLTGNRSASGQLGTVKWDDEGVVPQEAQFLTNGVLTDFQTTREQAEWLAPYYARTNRPTASHGYAAAEDALKMTMQHVPNLAVAPSSDAISLDRIIADIPNGILLTGSNVGWVWMDSQASTGLLLAGSMRHIKNGRLGSTLSGGGVQFNTLDLWKKIQTIGDASTVGSVAVSQYPFGTILPFALDGTKGQPPQVTSRTITAPAATILNQAVVDVTKKA